jgi:hypothetical protein
MMAATLTFRLAVAAVLCCCCAPPLPAASAPPADQTAATSRACPGGLPLPGCASQAFGRADGRARAQRLLLRGGHRELPLSLPGGWSERCDDDGTVYYFDEILQARQAHHPGLASGAPPAGSANSSIAPASGQRSTPEAEEPHKPTSEDEVRAASPVPCRVPNPGAAHRHRRAPSWACCF